VFVRACRDKIDGLRILQYLKKAQKARGYRDEDCLYGYFSTYQPNALLRLGFIKAGFTFEELSVESLNKIRDTLVQIEEAYQKAHHHA
jgi:hypothetical protein